MAYPVVSDVLVGAVAASFTQPIPVGHQSGDILLAIITQDTGGTTIDVPGWTQIGTQAAAQAQRTAAFWKLASSSAEADLSATGANDDWTGSITVIRGANTTTPIHASNRTDSANSTTAFLDSGTVTTSEANILLIYAWGFDNTGRLVPENPAHIVSLTKNADAAVCQIVGYRNQPATGTSQVVRALSEFSSEGGTALVIAISGINPSTPQMAPFCTKNYTKLVRYGGTPAANTTTAAFTRHDGITWAAATTIGGATINGLTVIDLTQVIGSIATTIDTWGAATSVSIAGSAVDATGRWTGGAHAITATNFSGRIFSVEWGIGNVVVSGAQGFIVVFQSSTGNWTAFQLSPSAGITTTANYVSFVDIDGATPYASAGTIDWTAVNRIGYLSHRVTTNNVAVLIRLKNALLLENTVLVDGSNASPVTPTFLQSALHGWGEAGLVSVQGTGQTLARYATNYGDGSRATYTKLSGTSYELPLSKNSTLARRFWDVPANATTARFVLDAGASDTVDFTSAIMASDSSQDWIVDAGSTGDSVDFGGLSIIGWRVTNNVTGFVINRANFSSARLITLNGGSLSGCTITASRVTPALVTNNPGNISGCSFVSAGTGHAIEMTAAGSFAFEGNSFSGYGSGGTTNAAIYNNSGGAITLTLGDGDLTPTVRNGTGASTTINAPQPDLTLTGLISGSRVYVRNTTDGVDLYNEIEATTEWVGSVPSGKALLIRVRNASGTPKYRPYQTTTTGLSSDVSIVVNQELDE
jgi:hypothetical protein